MKSQRIDRVIAVKWIISHGRLVEKDYRQFVLIEKALYLHLKSHQQGDGRILLKDDTATVKNVLIFLLTEEHFVATCLQGANLQKPNQS